MRRTAEGIPVVRIHYSANPKCTTEWAAAEKKRYTSQAWWNQEMEMQYEAMSGQRVYPEFDQTLHVIEHSRIPKRMCRFMAIDPHPRTPHAFLWIGIDAWHDWYVYRELWPSVVYGTPVTLKDDQEDKRFNVKDYAETVAVLEGGSIKWYSPETDMETGELIQGHPGICPRCGRAAEQVVSSCHDHRGPERIIERFMDQAGKGFIASGEHQQVESYADRYYRYGIQCADPVKSHKVGEDSVHELLKNRKHDVYGDWPRLHVSSRCVELILEFLKHRYKKTRTLSEEKELKQEGVESRCHLLDNLRYLACGRLAYRAELVS